MSDLAIVAICLTVIVITAILSATWYSINKVDPIEEARQKLLTAEDRFIESLKKPHGKDRVKLAPMPLIDNLVDEKPWLEDEPSYEPDSMAPIPVDPRNPPKPRIYSRSPGSTADTPCCTCHPGRPLEEGQEILWWPVPDSDVVKIFCQRENS